MMTGVKSKAAACFACGLAALFAGILSCALAPASAYAWFNDVTDSYPASQAVSVSGSPLTGADIPEGVYNITASTSSYMCKMSNVTLTSSGGGLWATFTLSKAYNALYLGTAEGAAASTNEDGTDVSAYYISDPLEGYVARQFSIPISALNQEMTIAAYSGGSKGNDKGMWYTRTVVFNSSSEVEDAIAAAASGGDDGGDDPVDDPNDDPVDSGGDDSGDYDDSGGSDAGDSDDSDVGDYDDDSGDDSGNSGGDEGDSSEGGSSDKGDSKDKGEGGSEGESSSSASPKASAGASGNTDDSADGNADEGDGEGADSEEESSDEGASDEAAGSESEAAKGGGARIREIQFAGNQVIELGEGDLDMLQQENDQDTGGEAAAAAAGALGAVNVALAGAYVVGLRRARPQLFAKAAEKISGFRRKG